MMAGGYAACQLVRKTGRPRLLEKGRCRASRRTPSFSPSVYDGLHLQSVSLSVGGCDVRTESRGNIERRPG